jgi:hypothetical protein
LFVNGFTVVTYTDEELSQPEYDGDDGDWVGQYVSHSIDSDHGLTVLLGIDKHQGFADMVDTICHEVGHGLWELLDGESQAAWDVANEEYRWGSVEAFADTFMHRVRGARRRMESPELFEQIVQPAVV